MGLSPASAAWLVAQGVLLVGIDYLSIDPYDAEPAAAHLTLLGAGVVVLEGLDLRDVPAGEYDLAALPLKLAGADGRRPGSCCARSPTGSRPRTGVSSTMNVQRRAKIVATIGPATDTEESLEALLAAGVDVVRLNFSHGTHAEHARRLEDGPRRSPIACAARSPSCSTSRDRRSGPASWSAASR